MNIVILNGNLTRDVEVRSTASGTTVMNFGLAVPDRKRNSSGEYEDYAHFVDCILFDPNNTRQWMVPMLRKGFHVTVHGKLNYTKWEKDGQKRSKLEVIVHELDGRWPPKQQQGYAPQQAPQQYQPAPPQQQQQYYPNQAPIGYQPQQGYAQAPVAPQQAPQAGYPPIPQYAPQQPPQAPTAPMMPPQQQMQITEDVYDEDIPF